MSFEEYTVTLNFTVRVNDITPERVAAMIMSDYGPEHMNDEILIEDAEWQQRMVRAILARTDIRTRLITRLLLDHLFKSEEEVREELGGDKEEGLHEMILPAMHGLSKRDKSFFFNQCCETDFKKSTRLTWESFEIGPPELTVTGKAKPPGSDLWWMGADG